MYSKELEERKVNHELHRQDIVYFARRHLFPGDSLITIEEVNRAVKKMEAPIFQVGWILKKRKKKEFKEQEAFITEQYNQLEKMLKEYRQEDTEIKKLMKKENKQLQVKQKLPFPIYIQKLYKAGLVESDGKTATGPLNSIAAFLLDECQNEFNKKITFSFLQRTFLQANGDVWSKSAARQAVTYAYNVTDRK